MADRPRVGISRCLQGDAVRYDGGHKRDAPLLAALANRVEWVPVCPEVEVGMGTPREPIQLVAAADGIPSGPRHVRLLGVRSGEDWTARMQAWAAQRARELAADRVAGFVLKKDSPSCGVSGVAVLDGEHEAGDPVTRDGRGLFAEALLDAMPGLPMEDEARLHDPDVRERFLASVAAYAVRRSANGAANPRESPAAPYVRIAITRADATSTSPATDAVAVEEPLEIRLNGSPFATIMRTPGADRELAAGFLLAEGVITGPDDLGLIRHCVDGTGDDGRNVLTVTLVGDAAANVDAVLDGRRAVTAGSACGVCGRRSIDDLLARLEKVRPPTMPWRVTRAVIERLPEALRGVQDVFTETGGLHGAALFDWSGALVAHAEDVGRHNAVDKVIGAQLLMERLPLSDRLLFVSGRTSFEIVQKAATAGIPLVASVSAPSSLAVDLARDAGLTLLGFVRGRTFNVYTSPARLEL